MGHCEECESLERQGEWGEWTVAEGRVGFGPLLASETANWHLKLLESAGCVGEWGERGRFECDVACLHGEWGEWTVHGTQSVVSDGMGRVRDERGASGGVTR